MTFRYKADLRKMQPNFIEEWVLLSHLACPLCGGNKPLSKFEPKSLDNNIYVVSFRGLGRGRGFKKTEETSTMAPGDPITEAVKERCLAIIGFLLEWECASLTEIYQSLNIEDPKAIREDVEALKAEYGDLKENIRNRIDDIRDVLGDEYEYAEDPIEDPGKALLESANALIEEYEASVDDSSIHELRNNIEEVIDVGEYDFDPEEYPMEALKVAVNILIEEYEAIEVIEEEDDE